MVVVVSDAGTETRFEKPQVIELIGTSSRRPTTVLLAFESSKKISESRNSTSKWTESEPVKKHTRRLAAIRHKRHRPVLGPTQSLLLTRQLHHEDQTGKHSASPYNSTIRSSPRMPPPTISLSLRMPHPRVEYPEVVKRCGEYPEVVNAAKIQLNLSVCAQRATHRKNELDKQQWRVFFNSNASTNELDVLK